MYCLTPLVLLALQGEPTIDPRMLAHPPQLDGVPRSGFAGEKVLYGTPYEHHVESANFTVQWSGDDATEAYAQTVIDALEQGWQALIVESGWPAPVSSDRYLLWVILDPTLSGSGFTTVYTSTEFPDGYPVSWVTPEYAEGDYPGFSLSVAVHEFSHMIQFGVRDWAASNRESWYWEASAEWMADQGVPEIDTYGLSTYWYTVDTAAAYNSTTDYHQYGMLILPVYLADAGGRDVVRTSWVENDGMEWADAIGQAAGEDLGAIIPEMAGAFAAGALTGSELFYPIDGWSPRSGEDDSSGLYGTLYVQATLGEREQFEVTGPATSRYASDGTWGPTPAGPNLTVAITRNEEQGTITWGVSERVDDSGTDTARDTADGNDDSDATPEPTDCGCATGTLPNALGLVAGGVLLLGRRRRAVLPSA